MLVFCWGWAWGLLALAHAAGSDSASDLENAGDSATDTAAVDTVSAPEALPSPPAGGVDTSLRSRVQAVWRGALVEFHAGHYAAAARRVRAAEAPEPLALIYRASFFAEASLRAGLRRQADSAVAAALPSAPGRAWQRYFYRLRLAAFPFDSAAPPALKQFCLQALAAPLESPVKTELLYRLLHLDSTALPDSERREALRQLIRVAPRDARLDSLYRLRAARFPPGHGDWDEQKLLLAWEEKLGRAADALARAQALLPSAPGASERQWLLWSTARFEVEKGADSAAVQTYREYRKSYGDSPNLLLQLARTYRNLSDSSESRFWYDAFAEKYPHSPTTADIHWMHAFEAEMAGRIPEAVAEYSFLSSLYPHTRQGEWAEFRIGWLYYKQSDYAAARQYFQSTLALDSSSAAGQAAAFWDARTCDALRDTAVGRAKRRSLCARYPFGFYGHVATFDLQSRHALPDSLSWARRFASGDSAAVKTWMRQIPGFQDTTVFPQESEYLPLAQLFAWHLDTLISLTVRSLSDADCANPWAVYRAARRCQDGGLWREANVLRQHLAARIPLELWGGAPKPVLRVLYPPAYGTIVHRAAAHAALPAALVFALMKQESGFNPLAVSSAGARGLMQMMPVTAALQAKHLDWSRFDADTLFQPEANITLGVAYLAGVVQRYGGNLYFALAHYNAGAAALSDWMPRLAGRPAENMVEDLDYTETREYVKRVLANFWTYQALNE